MHSLLPTVEYEEKLMIFSCFCEMFFIKWPEMAHLCDVIEAQGINHAVKLLDYHSDSTCESKECMENRRLKELYTFIIKWQFTSH